ncbi:MAG: tRNA (adenosine(37)-N6)-dimethylallyltransferase MiaA [Solirubrobacteraceae bacterium MAG38_C4-C5]|nr:tRNA (adenosine(37)-N6)-dimethylallyltransferase MiaA [Candidatus Siliceabacter maunaloa]
MPEVLALFGPTAVGKTAVAVALAQRLRARGDDPVAVSADALQVYRGLQILTDTASPAEQALLEHRLLAFVSIRERFSVAEYQPLAHAEIDGLLAAGRTPIVVGGTGLYLRAALAGLELRPAPEPGVRERLEADADVRGLATLHARLAEAAPWAAQRVAPTDRSRVVRALELHEQGALHPPPARSELWTARTRHPTRLVGLTMEREALRDRIDERVDAMLAAGVAQEVRAAAAARASPTARAAVGFRELLDGDHEAMRRNTRRYARRQMTWLRKLAGARLVDVTGRAPEDVAAQILP